MAVLGPIQFALRAVNRRMPQPIPVAIPAELSNDTGQQVPKRRMPRSQSIGPDVDAWLRYRLPRSSASTRSTDR
jgi:hypothetical protein